MVTLMKNIAIAVIALVMLSGCEAVKTVTNAIIPSVDEDPCVWSETNQGGYKNPFYQNSCRVDLVIRAAYKDINRREALPDPVDPEAKARKDKAIADERATVDAMSARLDEVVDFYRDGLPDAGALLDQLEVKLAEAGYNES